MTVHKKHHISRLVTKPTKWHVHPVKTQISLGIRPVWSESSLSAWRKLGSLATRWAHSEDSDQPGRSLRWAHSHFVGFVTRQLKDSGKAIMFLQWHSACRRKIAFFGLHGWNISSILFGHMPYIIIWVWTALEWVCVDTVAQWANNDVSILSKC